MLAGSRLQVLHRRFRTLTRKTIQPLQRDRGVLVEDHDAHAADDQLATLGLHVFVLPSTVSGVILEHVGLRDKCKNEP